MPEATPKKHSKKKHQEATPDKEDHEEDEPTVVSSSAFLCAIAQPLAGKKLHKKLYKAVKKGMST